MDDKERLRLERFNYEELDEGRATSDGIRPFIGTDERDNCKLTLEIFSTFKVEVDKEEEWDYAMDLEPPRPLRTQVIHPVVCHGFPSKILCEPWTWEKIRFFHLIRKHRVSLFDKGVVPVEDSIVVRQSVQRAINHAIRKADLDMMYGLLILDKIFFDFISFHCRNENFQNAPTKYTISQEHFTIAITQPENSIQTLRMLIKFDSGSVPWLNDDLKDWAEKQNNSFGKTILRLINKLQHGDPHIGRDIAMLMLDKNGSNARAIMAARRNRLESNLNVTFPPNESLERREIF